MIKVLNSTLFLTTLVLLGFSNQSLTQQFTSTYQDSTEELATVDMQEPSQEEATATQTTPRVRGKFEILLAAMSEKMESDRNSKK